MLRRNEPVKFVRDGRHQVGLVRSVVDGMAVIETGPMPVLGFFVAVPAGHVTQQEAVVS